MVGNLLSADWDAGRIVSVLEIRETKVIVNDNDWSGLKYDELSPIPLTGEWLHKFGVKWNNINGSEYYFTTTGLYQLRLDPPTKGEEDGWTPMTPDGDGSIGKEIFFVHQLQNLFYALTGEELTIKEPV